MTTPIVQELQDALDWQEMSTIEKIVKSADKSVNWSSIQLQTEHFDNQKLITLFAANDAFDCIWNGYSVLDYAVKCTKFCQWLMKNKAYCLYENTLLNYCFRNSPHCVGLILKAIAAKKTTLHPKNWLVARALFTALGTKNPVFWKQAVFFFPICLNQSIIRVDDDRAIYEAVEYKHAGYLLAFFQHYSGTKAVSKRVACRYGKRMLVPDMWEMAIGIAQLDLPHYLVCILCEAALDSLGNCAPWMWIDRTVATVSQVEKIAQK